MISVLLEGFLTLMMAGMGLSPSPASPVPMTCSESQLTVKVTVNGSAINRIQVVDSAGTPVCTVTSSPWDCGSTASPLQTTNATVAFDTSIGGTSDQVLYLQGNGSAVSSFTSKPATSTVTTISFAVAAIDSSDEQAFLPDPTITVQLVTGC